MLTRELVNLKSGFRKDKEFIKMVLIRELIK